MRSIEDVVGDLRRLGLSPGDVVMVHASLRAIGSVAGRAEGVLRALDQSVAPDGTVLMYLDARNDSDWVNAHPEAERPRLLEQAEPFAYLETPANPDNGVLAEVFRETSGTLVNDHPEARFGARGPLAHQLLDDAPWDDYYGPGSTLERLVNARGKVLRLGADLGTVTLVHYAEYLVPLPSKRRLRRFRRVLTPEGPRVRVVESLDDSDGIVDYGGRDYFEDLVRDYIATGRARQGRVGGAQSELIDAADLVSFSVEWMSRTLGSADTAVCE